MNTLKKIGLTALGTSLVASSAFAGEITASGDAGYTYSSEEVGVRTDEGYGFNHDITFSGSGELDNGFTVSTTMILVEGATLSSSNVALTMGGMGTITIGGGLGNVGGGFDAVTPFAYEENHDGMKTTTAIDSVGANMGSGSLMYFGPTVDLAGFGVQVMAGYAPEAANTAVTDGAVSASSNLWSSGSELGVKISGMGVTAGAYANELTSDASASVIEEDAMTATWHVSYTAGPVSLGYQTGGAETGVVGAATAATDPKAYTTASGNFEYEKMSIAANVSDNMSISWGELTETYDSQGSSASGATGQADVEMKSTSIQFAYSMGSMKISGYMTDTDNPGWDSDAKSDEVTELAVGFSF